jgi:hypothetical protein
MRRTPVFAAATLTLTATLAACTSTSVNTTPAGANQVQTTAAHAGTSAAPSTPAPSTPAAKKPAGVGDAIDLQSTKAGNVLEVTLTKVVDPSTAASDFFKPDAGKRYVAVQLRITNKGHATYSEDPQILAKTKDAAGQIYSIDFGTDTTAGPLMDSGLNLAPGDSTLGFLVFQVPTGQKVTQVQYSLSMLGGAVAQWAIG